MNKVTVFIPVYNTEKYIRQCLDSVLKQSYTDLEIILCNDCSTDNSFAICQEYEHKDSRVKIVNNERNLGLFNTRLKCLDFVSGDYFFQVDSDDWLEKDYIKVMMDVAEEYRVDVVQMGMIKSVDRWGVVSHKERLYHPGLYTDEQLSQYHHIFTQRVFSNNVCTKGIRTAILKKAIIQPSDIHYGDDLYFLQQISPYIRSVYVVPQFKYFYRYGGSMSNYNPKFWEDQSKLYWLRKAYALEHDPEYVKGLTLFFVDILKDVLKLQLFINQSENRVAETKAFLQRFYHTKDYSEMTAVDTNDEFIESLRKKDTNGILDYVCRRTSKFSLLKTKTLNKVFRLLSNF